MNYLLILLIRIMRHSKSLDSIKLLNYVLDAIYSSSVIDVSFVHGHAFSVYI